MNLPESPNYTNPVASGYRIQLAGSRFTADIDAVLKMQRGIGVLEFMKEPPQHSVWSGL